MASPLAAKVALFQNAINSKDLAQPRTYSTGKRIGKAYTRHKFDQRLHTQPGDRELLTLQR
jgi:hypothetical protein